MPALRRPLPTVLLLAWPAAVPPAAHASVDSPSGPPNVLLLMADDMGWGDVGFQGDGNVRTPHLDALARRGVVLERFYAAAPSCSPTRASVLTGRNPYRMGIDRANSGSLPASERTLSEILSERGYATGHFGKWHLGTLSRTVRESNRGGPDAVEEFSPPWLHGFQRCFSTEAKVPTWDPMLQPRGGKGGTWEPLDLDDAEPFGTHYWNERGEIVEEGLEGDDSRVIVDRVVPFLEASVARERPFLAVVWFHAPHTPVVAGPEFTAPYADLPAIQRHYYGSIGALDAQVGRLTDALAELGVARDTLVVFCSDNGPRPALGSTGPLRGRKASLGEGGLRVPGVIVWPARLRGGAQASVPAVTSDLLPTVLAAAGVELPDRPLDGVDLLPALTDPRAAPERAIGFECPSAVALVAGRHKIVAQKQAEGSDELGPFSLFDVVADPAEHEDLAAREPLLRERLARRLAQWRASCRRSAAGEDG